ncbi:MAG: hypothetical protein ACKO2K_14510, partial [Alphaproteobacteria bacterium]
MHQGFADGRQPLVEPTMLRLSRAKLVRRLTSTPLELLVDGRRAAMGRFEIAEPPLDRRDLGRSVAQPRFDPVELAPKPLEACRARRTLRAGPGEIAAGSLECRQRSPLLGAGRLECGQQRL